jgi:competence protein ComEA
MKPLMNVIIGVLAGLLAAGVLWLTVSVPRGYPVMLLPTPAPGVISIYVSGAVVNPGVYVLPANSRVDAAVKAAGGLAPSANSNGINLAALLKDAEQINVPGMVSTSQVNTGKVDINKATIAELDTLPGIGPTTAKSIVDYRIQHGPFKTIQEIENVPGIGPVTYDKIKNSIEVK